MDETLMLIWLVLITTIAGITIVGGMVLLHDLWKQDF